jgi:hypothetical protein
MGVYASGVACYEICDGLSWCVEGHYNGYYDYASIVTWALAGPAYVLGPKDIKCGITA